MTQWHIRPKPNIPADLLDFVGDSVVAQLLVQRGITTVEAAQVFLKADDYEPAEAEVMPDMERAVARLQQAIETQEMICVWGDFDVDGQTSTSLLVTALQNLGANVTYYIPNRLTESHGIKLPTLQQILAEGARLILTCDTGIEAHDAVHAAQAVGAEVIITDHHDLPDELPPAHAIINPKRLPEKHPLRELPGVGTAYKLIEALYKAEHRAVECEQFLDLVALGIVADVARQTGDTRYLLQRGLLALQETERIGLQALMQNAQLDASKITEEHIGFTLAPRLNALGRLGDANLGVELLTTDDPVRARTISLQLEAFNDRRKMLVDRVVVQALSQVEDVPSLAERNAIVLAAADWHPGVIGIAASRLVEQFNKPTILIAVRPDGIGRGSARSLAGCDIHQALKTQADLLHTFGGHPMAAGLSLDPENLVNFRRGLSEALVDCTESMEKRLEIDLEVELADVSPKLLHSIQRLAPFGAGNPSVRLATRGLTLTDEIIFGKTGTHKRLLVADEAEYPQEIIWWSGANRRSPEGTFDLAFNIGPNFFKGGHAIQATLIDFQEWHPAADKAAIEFIDWRQEANLHALLASLPKDTLIWAEGEALTKWQTVSRQQLQSTETLVLWSTPAAPGIFQQLITLSQPQQVYLIGQSSPFDTFPTFVKQLMGLVKYALTQKEGEIVFKGLAAALGHQLTAARLGLDWLVAQGKLSIYVEEEDLVVLRPAKNPPSSQVAYLEQVLKDTIAETAAYRRFFKTAQLEALRKTIL